jgi:hypothetical protein
MILLPAFQPRSHAADASKGIKKSARRSISAIFTYPMPPLCVLELSLYVVRISKVLLK